MFIFSAGVMTVLIIAVVTIMILGVIRVNIY